MPWGQPFTPATCRDCADRRAVIRAAAALADTVRVLFTHGIRMPHDPEPWRNVADTLAAFDRQMGQAR